MHVSGVTAWADVEDAARTAGTPRPAAATTPAAAMRRPIFMYETPCREDRSPPSGTEPDLMAATRRAHCTKSADYGHCDFKCSIGRNVQLNGHLQFT
jgi:hypothetical protein